jgi:hypothetical protein
MVANKNEPVTLDHLRYRSTPVQQDQRSPRDEFRTGADVLPRSGDVIHVTKAASVQFAAPMLFRVIRVHDWPTYEGWTWLDGYELNTAGDAVERRSIFVQVTGLRQVGKAPDPRMRNNRRPGLASDVVPTRAIRANR